MGSSQVADQDCLHGYGSYSQGDHEDHRRNPPFHSEVSCYQVQFDALNPLTPIYSERKWKGKLKEWKFEKNIAAADMSILVAMAEKRKRDEGKETRFFHSGAEIKSEKFENFKKRRMNKSMDLLSPTVGER